jgi:hypothetical protein
MNENIDLKKIEYLEINNKSLISKLQKLQTALSNHSTTNNNQLKNHRRYFDLNPNIDSHLIPFFKICHTNYL